MTQQSHYWAYNLSVQSLSHVWLFATPWTAARQASLSITNCRSLPKLMSTESVMPSNQLILCHPLFFLPSIFPSIRVWIFKWVSSLHQVATVLEFQLQHLTGLKPGVNRAAFLLEILGEDPSPCLFQLVDAPHIPWLVVPSAIFRTSKSFSDSVSLVLPLWPPSSTFKDAYD